MINADPDAWYAGDPEHMGAEAYADFRRAIHDPATVHAMCEDYRAGLGVDRAADDADRAAGRTDRLPCAVALVPPRRHGGAVRGRASRVAPLGGPSLEGGTVDSGHHMAEEAPAELAGKLATFFAR